MSRNQKFPSVRFPTEDLITMATKLKFTQSRDTVLRSAGLLANSGRRTPNSPCITERDYAPVPPPLNLKVGPAGNCMVWLWKINNDGYGTCSFPDGVQLAHRQAFTESRGHQPTKDVLHLCHRPFCIQPSHLYDGTASENSEDRKLRVSHGIDFQLLNKKAEVVQSVAKYQWNSPRNTSNKALFLTQIEHQCDFIIPAMDGLICPTCGRDQDFDEDSAYFEGVTQPDNTDRNVSHISSRSRSIRHFSDGLSMSGTFTTEITIPKTRAERRRRKREERKAMRNAKPILLGSQRVSLKPGETTRIKPNWELPSFPGPGILVHTVRPIDPRPSLPRHDTD